MDVGVIVEGKVSGIAAFGAFVLLPDGRTGLVHISEIATTYVKDVKAHLKENDKVKVKVLTIDDNGKINLSIKRVQDQSERVDVVPSAAAPPDPVQVDFALRQSSLSFEEKMKHYMKDSDEKIRALKRSEHGKHKGGHYRRAMKA